MQQLLEELSLINTAIPEVMINVAYNQKKGYTVFMDNRFDAYVTEDTIMSMLTGSPVASDSNLCYPLDIDLLAMLHKYGKDTPLNL